MKSFLSPLLREPSGRFCLANLRNGAVLAEHLLTAFESKTRNKGLLGRESLGDGEALIIAPSNAVHTWFMKFPIDIAFVERSGRVVKTRNTVPPWRIAAALRAFAVIELPAGTLDRCRTVRGDELVVVAPAAAG
jgi:uncharacterized membrane protein (UPF0127 family)